MRAGESLLRSPSSVIEYGLGAAVVAVALIMAANSLSPVMVQNASNYVVASAPMR